MNNEQKILDILAALQGDMQSMQGQMQSMQDEMHGLEGRLTDEIQSVRGEMHGIETRLDEKIDDVRTGIMAYIETEVNTKLQLLAEGHQVILETLAPKTRVDELEDRVKFLESVLSQVLDNIQELKRAQ